MKATRQLVWLAALTLLAQPLAALPACQPADAMPAECCPGPHPAAPEPVNASADDPGCCQVTSSEPTPSLALMKSTERVAARLATPAAGAALEVAPEPAAFPVADSSPRASSSPLHTLYCVFLI